MSKTLDKNHFYSKYQAQRVILSVAKDLIKHGARNNFVGSFATLRMTRWAWVLSTQMN